MDYNEIDPFGRRRRPQDPTFSGATTGAVSTVPLSTGAVPRSSIVAGEPDPGTAYTGPPSTPDPTSPTPAQTFKTQPVDQGKWDSGYQSPKYDTLHTLSGFDPSKGITSDVLNALNAKGYANFYGSGQHLGYNAITDKGRSIGFVDPFEGDFIQQWGNGTNPNAQWAWDYKDPAAPLDLSSAWMNLPQTQTQTDLSWLAPLLANLKTPQTTPYYAPPNVAPASEPAPATAYGEPGPTPLDLTNPQVGQAIRMLAMRAPQLLQGRGDVTDPLMAQILQLIGA